MRKRDREEGGIRALSFSLASFLPSPAAHPSIDRRATLLRAAFVPSPPAAFPSSFPAKPSRHADPTGILNARREADCLTAYAKPRSLDGGMAAREISTRKWRGSREPPDVACEPCGYLLRVRKLLPADDKISVESRRCTKYHTTLWNFYLPVTLSLLNSTHSSLIT